MAWLRLDDGFPQHPKIVSLTPRDRWTWLEILCYCARYRTDGHVPSSVREVVRGATAQYLARAERVGLLDHDAHDDYLVHDWGDYNGRDPKIVSTERKRAQRRRDTAVTNDGTLPGQERDICRDKNVTRARARGRVPVPNPNPNPKGSSVNDTPTNQPTTEANYAADAAEPNGTVSPGMAGWLENEQENNQPIGPAFDYDTILRDIPF